VINGGKFYRETFVVSRNKPNEADFLKKENRVFLSAHCFERVSLV
jgi:hypothetical protein